MEITSDTICLELTYKQCMFLIATICLKSMNSKAFAKNWNEHCLIATDDEKEEYFLHFNCDPNELFDHLLRINEHDKTIVRFLLTPIYTMDLDLLIYELIDKYKRQIAS